MAKHPPDPPRQQSIRQNEHQDDSGGKASTKADGGKVSANEQGGKASAKTTTNATQVL